MDTTMAKKSLLIIGGGAAGSLIAYQLRDVANVTLVDPKTYWEVPMAFPRLLVDPDGLPARMRYDSFLGDAKHIQGAVTSLTDTSARITQDDGTERTLAFDYAIIASGSTYVDPLVKAMTKTEEGRTSEIAALNERLKSARSVVIAGGGPVGIETAAELRENFPDIKVTVIDGAAKVLAGAPSKFPAWADRDLRAKGVEFILDDLVKEPAMGAQPTDGNVVTTKGRSISADLLIWAAGAKPNTAFVASSWPEVVQRDGLLMVDAYLRLAGHPNLFVVGDVTNLPEGRLAIVVGLHAKSVVANLKSLLAAPTAADVKLKPYKPAPPGKGMGKMMIVTLGRNDGLTSLPFGQFRASFLARKIKSTDMLVGMSRKSLGFAG